MCHTVKGKTQKAQKTSNKKRVGRAFLVDIAGNAKVIKQRLIIIYWSLVQLLSERQAN